MNKKIIIGLVLAIVIACAATAYIALDMMDYEKKTVEIFENGTSMEVPATLELTNRTEDIVNFDDKENTTHIVGFRYDDSENFLNINGIVESIVDEYIHNVTDKAELQDNGVFKLSADQRKKIAAQSGINIKDKDDAKDLYIGILKNESLNQTIIVVSENEQYVVDMMDSIEWKASSIKWKASSKERVTNETVTEGNTNAPTNNHAKSTNPVEEVDPETGYTSTQSGVSAENNEADYSDYEVDYSDYEGDSSDEEITYGEEEFHVG